MNVDSMAYYLPQARLKLNQLQSATGSSNADLRIFDKFYGLKQIAIAEQVTVLDMAQQAVNQIFENNNYAKNEFNYLVLCHVSRDIYPFSGSIAECLRVKLQLTNAIAFASGMLKCVSAISMFAVLELLLRNKKCAKALVITADLGFTPALRLVPRVTICGDAASACVVNASGTQHKLLAVSTRFQPGFTKGIYLEPALIKDFDQDFIATMAATILTSLAQANVNLAQISLILPHNVNFPTWEKIASYLKIPLNKIYTRQIAELGHCFASDGILNLSMALDEGLLEKNDYYLLAGCGVGYFFASAVFRY